MADRKSRANSAEHIYDTFIVGAGISGLATAITLNRTGYQNFKIIEKADRVGGTWRENTYPGCGCDVPSSLYSYSFAPSNRWSHLFARQPEILEYLEKVSDDFGITPLIEFNNELNEARWDEKRHLWQLDTQQGQYLSRTVVFATGPITESRIPDIPGLDTFKGEMFHSARWNHDYDLTGKRIAVIGTGASAIQFVPRIQPQAKELHVFQRTAPWVLPKPDMHLGKTGKQLIGRYPAIQSSWRKTVAGCLNVINFGLRNPAFLKPVNTAARQLLKLQIRDPELRKAVTPNFDIGCKRILFANDYYDALQADNTSLIPSGLVKVEGNTVIAANGERREVDVIIWGTGFDVSHPPIGDKVFNAKGEKWADLWKDSSPEAYLGTALKDSPNAFLILGPNASDNKLLQRFVGRFVQLQANHTSPSALLEQDFKLSDQILSGPERAQLRRLALVTQQAQAQAEHFQPEGLRQRRPVTTKLMTAHGAAVPTSAPSASWQHPIDIHPEHHFAE